MLSGAQDSLFTAPWLAVYPGVLILVSVVTINLLGDALRARLHPAD
jgi:peptide/nickel transport system permease protein